MRYNLDQLPVLLTAQELARALGLTDPRRLNADRRPVAQVFINGQARPLFNHPRDGIYSYACDTKFGTTIQRNPPKPKMSNWSHPDNFPAVPDWYPAGWQPVIADDSIPGIGDSNE